MTQQEQIWQDVMELANRPGTFTHGLGPTSPALVTAGPRGS